MQEPQGKATSGGTRERPPVTGGKALARLQYFELQRGLNPTQPRDVANSPDESAAPAPFAFEALTDPHAAVPSPYERVLQAAEETRSRRSQEMELAAVAAPPVAPEAPPPVPPAQWRSLGPTRIPNGQTYGTGIGSRVVVSGRVSAIAVDPHDPRHVLVGAAAGGIWETRDDGATWAPRTDSLPTLAVGAIAFDPRDSNIVYAGTGEGNYFFHLGAGLIGSKDGGTTWKVIAADPLRGKGFFDLKVNALNRQHLIAGIVGYNGSGGLYESRDGGVTWATKRSGVVWSVSIRPPVAGTQPGAQEIFAAFSDGLFVSQDTGATWTKVALPGAPSGFSRMAVAHAPSNGDVVYVWAAGNPGIPDPKNSGSMMPTPYLWTRTSAGGAFTRIKSPPLARTGQSWYDWHLAVSPSNPTQIYVADIELHRGDKVGSNWRWTELSDKSNADSIHPDQHYVATGTGSSNVVYAGCDGGIFRSPDAGMRWVSLNPGLCIAEFEFIAQHPTSTDWILGGVQDNGTLRYEGGPEWKHVADGDGGGCGANSLQPEICYHSFYAMGLQRSTDGGNSWQDLRSAMGISREEDYPDGALFYPPVAVRERFVAQGGITVFMSGDDGENWDRCQLPSDVQKSTAIAIVSPVAVYVGTETGDIVLLQWDGTRWGAMKLSRPRAGYVSDLELDSNNAQRLWATYSTIGGSQVFRSDDGGTTWTPASNGLPQNVPANAIIVDPAFSDRLYVGLDLGVYRSLDAGGSWSDCSAGLPNALVKDLCIHQASRRLRAATQSRGVWEIEIDHIG